MASDHHVGTEVKLSAVVEERPSNVLLHNQRALPVLFNAFYNSALYVLELIHALYSITSVGKLSRFQYPKVIFFAFLYLVKIACHSL